MFLLAFLLTFAMLMLAPRWMKFAFLGLQGAFFLLLLPVDVMQLDFVSAALDAILIASSLMCMNALLENGRATRPSDSPEPRR